MYYYRLSCNTLQAEKYILYSEQNEKWGDSLDHYIIVFTVFGFVFLLAIAGYISWYMHFPQKAKGKKKKIRVLCIGDSITFGYGVRFTRWKDSYPAILEKKLGAGIQVMNYGISGATLLSESDRPYKDSFRDAARKTDPAICILMLGTNDSKPHNWNAIAYEESLKKWINYLTGFPSEPKIILMVPPAAFSIRQKPVAFSVQNDVLCEQIAPIMKRKAQAQSLKLIDLYAQTASHPEWFVDGVHPNKQGNQAIADCVYPIVSDMLQGVTEI